MATGDLGRLKDALDVIIASEYMQEEFEDANYHRVTDFLKEVRSGIHECRFNDGAVDVYDDGSYETECIYDGCYRTQYTEVES